MRRKADGVSDGLRLVSIDDDRVVPYRIVEGEHVVGRSIDVDVVVANPNVSRRHARLHRRGRRLEVVDLRSSNGTYVNGERIVGCAILRPGDLLSVGPVALRVQAGVDEPAGARRRRRGARLRGPVKPAVQPAVQPRHPGSDVRSSGSIAADGPWNRLVRGALAGRVLTVVGLLAAVGVGLWLTILVAGLP